MFAQNQLRQGNQKLSEAQKRLSSGLRINSASDDAAGLAISQKMETQVRGLDMATKNAQDGIAMLQTAEGSLGESQSSLQRMRELAVQASNDTLTEDDRQKIQSEINALAKEMQRIADQTQFNEKNLLDGNSDIQDVQFQVGANEQQTIEFSIDNMGTDDDALAMLGNAQQGEIAGSTPQSFIGIEGNDSIVASSAVNTESQAVQFESAEINTSAAVTDGSTAAVSFVDTVAGDYTVGSGGTRLENKEGELVASVSGSTGEISTNNGTLIDFGSGATLSAGETITIGGPSVATTDKAASSITQVDDAISELSSERSDLGALINRLETTVSVDNITSQNLDSARSRIRDADVAQESVKQTQGNILVQAGTSVLAQANSNPQLALQLLGG
jgi:flagellin